MSTGTCLVADGCLYTTKEAGWQSRFLPRGLASLEAGRELGYTNVSNYMQDSGNLMCGLVLSNETFLLLLVVVLVIVFVGLLAFDLIRRRNRSRRWRRSEPEGLRPKLLKPVRRAGRLRDPAPPSAVAVRRLMQAG